MAAAAYAAWVRHNRAWLAQLEGLASTLTWLLPERLAASELAPEMMSTAIGLLSTLNQYIVDTDPANRFEQRMSPLLAKGMAAKLDGPSLSVLVAVLKELELLGEMIAIRFLGEDRKWTPVAGIEAAKALVRLMIFSQEGSRMLLGGGLPGTSSPDKAANVPVQPLPVEGQNKEAQASPPMANSSGNGLATVATSRRDAGRGPGVQRGPSTCGEKEHQPAEQPRRIQQALPGGRQGVALQALAQFGARVESHARPVHPVDRAVNSKEPVGSTLMLDDRRASYVRREASLSQHASQFPGRYPTTAEDNSCRPELHAQHGSSSSSISRSTSRVDSHHQNQCRSQAEGQQPMPGNHPERVERDRRSMLAERDSLASTAKELPGQAVFPAIQGQEPNQMRRLRNVAEVLHILRPLVYVMAIRRWGPRSWKPWLLSAAVDLSSLGLVWVVEGVTHLSEAQRPQGSMTAVRQSQGSRSDWQQRRGSPSGQAELGMRREEVGDNEDGGGKHGKGLDAAELEEPHILRYVQRSPASSEAIACPFKVRRRQMLLALYLMRSPCFENLTRRGLQSVEGALKPLPLLGTLAEKAMELVEGIQSYHFYTAAS